MAQLNHIGIFTAHPKRLLNFYTCALGFTTSQEAVLPKRIVYGIFKLRKECTMVKLFKDAVCLEVFWLKEYKLKPNIKGAIGYNHFGLGVENRDAWLMRLIREFKVEVTKIKRGDHYNYFIRDPDKNIIEIKELK